MADAVEVEVVAAPIPVAVVRPKVSPEEIGAKFFTGVLVTLVVAWLLMLIAGEVVPEWGLSYAHTILILVALRLVQVVPRSSSWTHKAKGSAL